MPAPAQLPPDAVPGADFDFVPPPCLLPELPDDARWVEALLNDGKRMAMNEAWMAYQKPAVGGTPALV